MTPTDEAAMPAVEEMAERIIEAAEYAQACKASGTTPAVAFVSLRNHILTELAPLYARIADLEQQLSRNQQFVADQGRAIAEYAEALGECRNHLLLKGGQKVNVAPPNCDPLYRPIYSSVGDLFIRDRLLAKLDALLGAKGGEDGKDQ